MLKKNRRFSGKTFFSGGQIAVLKINTLTLAAKKGSKPRDGGGRA
ncbi:hypothetical protein DAQ1742_03667 [Dickeya aquatica]|uniref:Uncharacterized protein n=1 Tax=Dickeya aquatica TaxID=1401087 RepID=A0A375AF05_9GAMM|nr:hypothetical protein DAQ1742_03667 [Dickeya aquatica]